MRDNELKEDRTIEAYYAYIGKKYYENLINEVDQMEDVELDSSNLDAWFQDFTKAVEKEVKSDKRRNALKENMKRVAIVFFAMSMSFTVLLTTVEAFRVKVFNLFIVEESKYTEISFDESSELQIEGIRNIQEFPSGIKLIAYHDLNTIHTIDYEDANGNPFKFTQSNKDVAIHLDTEDTQLIRVDIGDNDGYYMIKNGVITVYWNDDNNNFSIVSSLPLEQIIETAKSVD